MNAAEVCEWLSAAEQIQEPVLKNLWSLAKGAAEERYVSGFSDVSEAMTRLDRLNEVIRGPGRYKGVNAERAWEAFIPFYRGLPATKQAADAMNTIDGYIKSCRTKGDHEVFGIYERDMMVQLVTLRSELATLIESEEISLQESADKPLYFSVHFLHDPTALFSAARAEQGDTGLQLNLRGLHLRLRNRLNDKRWGSFLNYEAVEIRSANAWFERLGIGRENTADVCVIDCSMLSYEVLPYATGVIGRTILELREHVQAEDRFHEPWVLVLEEAHNYVRPRRQTEDRGIAVSREAFERIAKEGRKFGLSLIVASQRPSEISPTVLSQCANFIMHRLQNPEDIEHFRSIVPSQSRRLLDQATILGPGEAIVVGSAYHVPSRVKIHKPSPEPSSQSSVPHLAWQPGAKDRFALASALRNWGINPAQAAENSSTAVDEADPTATAE